MDYTTLLVKQYAFVKAAHKLSEMLDAVYCEKGVIYGPTDLKDSLLNFSEKLDDLAVIYNKQYSDTDSAKVVEQL